MHDSVDTYRRRLEDMLAEVMEEHYQNGAGHKATFDIAAVYERYADLTTLEQARALAAQHAGPELERFACEAYIGDGVKLLAEELTNTQTTLVVPVDGGEVPYREVAPRILNEPDPAGRRALYAARCAATAEHLNPLHEQVFARTQSLVADVGDDSVLGLYERFGYAPRRLNEATSAFLRDTDDLYRRTADAELRRRVGIPLADAGPADLARMWRAPEFDAAFPTDRAVPALRATLRGLGIDLHAQANVHLDIDARPGKVPRAFCAPIRVPDRVMLVMLPQGGQDDYRALFHEAGHAEHFAHMPPSLPAEARVLGDNAVTEGFAFLFEHLLADPAWARLHLDGGDPGYPRFAALYKLFLVRRYAGKLAYEIELHAPGARLSELPGRYAGHLSAATAVPYPETDYLEDVDDGFYCTCYLRAWAFEAALVDHLRERFGPEWFAQPAAGDLLRELWSLGQSLRVEELLMQVTGAQLDFGILTAQAEAALG
jgi:hypothetical protein